MTQDQQHRDIIRSALNMGAITDEQTNAGVALAALADVDLDAAKKFASQSRTPIERVELHLRMQGQSLRVVREFTRKMGAADPDAALIAAYGE